MGGGGGAFEKIPSREEVWIFFGTTQSFAYLFKKIRESCNLILYDTSVIQIIFFGHEKARSFC